MTAGEAPIKQAVKWIDDQLADRPGIDRVTLVDEYLRAAHARGFREVRLIHGRGIGVQRGVVQTLLRHHPLVADFGDAPEERGGRGATIVRMR